MAEFEHGGHPVVVREGNLLAATFHPDQVFPIYTPEYSPGAAQQLAELLSREAGAER